METELSNLHNIENEKTKNGFQELENRVTELLEEEQITPNDRKILEAVCQSLENWPSHIKRAFNDYKAWQGKKGQEPDLAEYLKMHEVGRWQYNFPHHLHIFFQGAETARPDSVKVGSDGKTVADYAIVSGSFSPSNEDLQVNDFLSGSSQENLLEALGIIGSRKKQGLPESWQELLYEEFMRQRWDSKFGVPKEQPHIKEAIKRNPESFEVNFTVPTNIPGLSVHYLNDNTGMGRRFLALEIDEGQKAVFDLLRSII